MTESQRQFEQKLNKKSEKKIANYKTKEGRIKSSMQIFRRRSQSTVRRAVSKRIKRQLNLDSSVDLRHKSQIKGDVKIIDGVGSEDEGEKNDNEGEEEDVDNTRWGKVICAKPINKLLLVLDVNETLLYNKFRPVHPGSTRGEYTEV